jgi:mono/diheme cytochrome c family protein
MLRGIIIALIVFGAGGALFFLNPPRDSDPTRQSSGPLVAVTVPELTALEAEGEQLFSKSCAVCHGQNAVGRGDIAPSLVQQTYRPIQHADAAFVFAVRDGVRAHHWKFGNMPKVAGVTEEDIGKITAYIRALQRANGIQ